MSPPPPKRPSLSDEFAIARGERPVRGDRRALGLLRRREAVPGPIPSDPTVVVSAFETRPVGAHDFATHGLASISDVSVTNRVRVEFGVPNGYVAVLRVVRLEWVPPGASNVAFSVTPNSTTASILRDSAPIANNTVRFLGDLTTYEWLTHHIFGPNETFGLLLTVGPVAIPAGAVPIMASVNMFGVLLPSKSRPPSVEISSPPILVQIAPTPPLLIGPTAE